MQISPFFLYYARKTQKSFFFFPSDIFRSTVRTQPFAAKRLAAVATDVACTAVAEVAPEGKDGVGYEQQVAYVVEGEHAEGYVVDGADGGKTEQVEQ